MEPLHARVPVDGAGRNTEPQTLFDDASRIEVAGIVAATMSTERRDKAADAAEAARRRDVGLDKLTSGWADRWFLANAYLGVAYKAASGDPFGVDDLRDYGELRLPSPSKTRGWAPVMSTAHRRAIVMPVGATRSARPSSNGALIQSWKGTAVAQKATPEEWLTLAPEIELVLDYLGCEPLPPAELLRRLGAFRCEKRGAA